MEDKQAILDQLLQEKHERERLANWKSEIPMPELENTATTKSKNRKKLSLSALIILLLGISYYFVNSKKDNLVDHLIATTPIAFVEDQNHRGQNELDNKSTQSLVLSKHFDAAIKELKSGGDLNLAIDHLETLSRSKNKYQIDALWWKALTHAKANEKEAAIHELQKLKALSNYQKENIKKLLEELK